MATTLFQGVPALKQEPMAPELGDMDTAPEAATTTTTTTTSKTSCPRPAPLAPVKRGAGLCYLRREKLTLPSQGLVSAGLCRGFLRRYQRSKRNAPPPPRLPVDQEWVVTLSGHKKGSNPRIKLEDGRLWCLRLPEGCSLVSDMEGPAIFARPVRQDEAHRLELYKRQPVADSVVFSLTNGADKCYLRPALQYKHFQFVFGLRTSQASKIHWFVTEEYITLKREKSAAAKRKAAEKAAAAAAAAAERAAAAASTAAAPAAGLVQGRSAPDGCDDTPVHREGDLFATAAAAADSHFARAGFTGFGDEAATAPLELFTPQSFLESIQEELQQVQQQQQLLLQQQQQQQSLPAFPTPLFGSDAALEDLDPTFHLAAGFLDDAVLHTQQQQMHLHHQQQQQHLLYQHQHQQLAHQHQHFGLPSAFPLLDPTPTELPSFVFGGRDMMASAGLHQQQAGAASNPSGFAFAVDEPTPAAPAPFAAGATQHGAFSPTFHQTHGTAFNFDFNLNHSAFGGLDYGADLNMDLQ